jgi:hypothetical protein
VVRVVVTGHDRKGRAVFARDDELTGVEVSGVARFFRVWSADGPMTYPEAGTDPGAADFFPPVGGVCCTVVDLAPGGSAPEAGDLTPDFDVLELDDGVEVTLSAGDLVVQKGTAAPVAQPG